MLTIGHHVAPAHDMTASLRLALTILSSILRLAHLTDQATVGMVSPSAALVLY